MNQKNQNMQSVLSRAARWTVLVITGAAMSARAASADPAILPATPLQPANTTVNKTADTSKAANDVSKLATFTPAVSTVSLVQEGIDSAGRVELSVNKTSVVTTKEKVKRISIGQPEVADVTMVGPTTLLVTAKKFGTTQLIVWDEQERSQTIDINVVFDIQALKDQYTKMFPDAGIQVEMLNGVMILKGRVPSLKIAEQAAKIAGAYSKDVLNFLEVSGGQQIMLHMQFIEMSRSASQDLGFRFFFNDGNPVGFNNGPGGDSWGGLLSGNSGTISSAITFFATGNLGNTPFEVFVNALKKNNLARTLAEPTLIAINGQPASFLAGGEIPIPVPQPGGGGSSITIEYKQFGVKLNYTAAILGDGRIKLKVQPEVSELDYANGTSINGQKVPGIRTRKVDTEVEMAEGQTLALAGLLQRRVDTTVSATPLLGDLPIVGTFFRSTSYARSETELVILVSPHLTGAMNPSQVPALPGGNWRYPNEAQLFAFGDQGGPVKTATTPAEDKRLVEALPRFIGPNGFDESTPVEPTVATVDQK